MVAGSSDVYLYSSYNNNKRVTGRLVIHLGKWRVYILLLSLQVLEWKCWVDAVWSVDADFGPPKNILPEGGGEGWMAFCRDSRPHQVYASVLGKLLGPHGVDRAQSNESKVKMRSRLTVSAVKAFYQTLCLPFLADLCIGSSFGPISATLFFSLCYKKVFDLDGYCA